MPMNVVSVRKDDELANHRDELEVWQDGPSSGRMWRLSRERDVPAIREIARCVCANRVCTAR
jgi:hypothetical protein